MIIPILAPAGLDRSVDHSFDPVTVGIDDERREIVFAVFRAQLGRSVVLTALRERRCVKASHAVARRRGKGDVKSLPWNRRMGGSESDGEFVSASGQPVANRGGVCPDPNVTESRKRGVVKGRGAREVCNCE